MHERQFHDLAIFVTLTYDPAKLPPRGSLDRTHVPAFFKRLRQRMWRDHQKTVSYLPPANRPPVQKIKYFYCGEYGEETGRPHYHAIIYGVDFNDKTFYKTSSSGDRIFTSKLLDDLWSHGQCNIGSVSFQSCGYVARYCLKKITGELAENHYRRLDEDTGEWYQLEPEFSYCSKGIGERWIEKFQSDCFPSDRVVINGVESGAPRYYRKKLEKADPKLAEKLKYRRISSAAKRKADNTPERLAVRHECRKAKTQTLKRTL